MPLLSKLYGIEVHIRWNDHPPPYFHVFYAGSKTSIAIGTLEIIDGRLPRRARVLVIEWALSHRPELRAAWQKACRSENPGTIEPLSWLEAAVHGHMPTVVSVHVLRKRIVHLVFDDGVEGDLDLSNLKYAVFAEVYVDETGTINWPPAISI